MKPEFNTNFLNGHQRKKVRREILSENYFRFLRIIFFILFLAFAGLGVQRILLSRVNSRLKKRYTRMMEEFSTVLTLKKECGRYEEMIEKLRRKNSASRKFYPLLCGMINTADEDIIFNNVDFTYHNDRYVFSIRGSSDKTEAVTGYFEGLRKSGLFQNVKPIEISEGENGIVFSVQVEENENK